MYKKLIFLFITLAFLLSCHNKKLKQKAIRINDTIAHHYFKKAIKNKNQFINDSAYYYLQKSEKHALKIDDSALLTQIYFNKAIIDYKNSDLPTSEAYCVKAINFTPKKQYLNTAPLYNLLGSIAEQKGDTVTAIEYYKKAFKLYQNSKEKLKGKIIFHNNMSNIFYNRKKYSQSLIHIDSILSINNIKQNHTNWYAEALNNKAKILLKQNKLQEAKKIIDKTFIIHDITNNIPGKIISLLNYANYFQQNKLLDNAKNNALQALQLSKKAGLIKNQLKSYKKLAELDTINSRHYLTEYIKISDSIEFEQEKVKEQTARIRYENQEKLLEIERKNQIIKQKNIHNNWMFTLLIVVLISLLLFYRQLKKIKDKNLIIKKQNQQVYNKNKLIKTIYQEMHHRIKNNFDIINFVFIDRLIRNEHTNNLYKEELTNLQNKIASMKELHLLLQNSEPTLTIQLNKYVNKVIKQTSYTFSDKIINFKVNISEHIKIHFKQAFPIGLIVNEFITNSYKYAFENTPYPTISIIAKDLGDKIELALKDNGKGLPDNFSITNTKSQGLKMIYSLIRQLKAKIIQKNKNGLEFIIIFPKII